MIKKLFSEKQTSVVAALAGPIPAGILIYLNYRALGKEREAYASIVVTLGFTIILFYSILQLPEAIIEKIPNFLFTTIYGVFVYLFYRHYMADEVSTAMEQGSVRGSNWTVAFISIFGLILNLAILVGLALDKNFYDGELVEVKGNQLYYDAGIPESNVTKFLDQLEAQDFFGQDYGNIARLQLIGDEYFITLVVDEQLWSDDTIISYVTSMKWLMEVEFGKPTSLKLESISLSGSSKFKYITQ